MLDKDDERQLKSLDKLSPLSENYDNNRRVNLDYYNEDDLDDVAVDEGVVILLQVFYYCHDLITKIILPFPLDDLVVATVIALVFQLQPTFSRSILDQSNLPFLVIFRLGMGTPPQLSFIRHFLICRRLHIQDQNY